ncbi:hypothetical protein FD754_020456, partial [Muntiacus muntjak]
LFKKIRDTKGTFHAQMGTIKDRSVMDPTEAEDMKKRWQEYTEELHKKDHHDPDNLECEPSLRTKLFLFQSQRNTMPKNAQTTTQMHSSHTLTNVVLEKTLEGPLDSKGIQPVFTSDFFSSLTQSWKPFTTESPGGPQKVQSHRPDAKEFLLQPEPHWLTRCQATEVHWPPGPELTCYWLTCKPRPVYTCVCLYVYIYTPSLLDLPLTPSQRPRSSQSPGVCVLTLLSPFSPPSPSAAATTWIEPMSLVSPALASRFFFIFLADSLTQFCSETCSCKLYVLPQNKTSKKIWVKVDCFRTSESITHRHFSVESILCHPTATCRILYFFKKTCTRRPPLPPRPMPPRRKPLPPNNVTGKPGSAGIISSGRVTSPPLRATLRPTEAPLETMETDKKPPTVPASEEDLDNMTDFSSSPTRETDPLGKPRFKGPHVRYIQKPDDSPCSITDSVKRFPKEEATEGNATSPPQNPPTNLTVVTVEGCPSFVILDWDKPLNDTVTEYEVISRENGSFSGKNKSIQTTNQTFSTVENLKPDTRVSEPVSAGRDAIWTERPFNSDSYSECQGKQYVKRTWYKKFVGVQLCNSLRYKIYLSDSLTGKFYNIGDQRGHGEDHCQFVDSFLDGRTGQQLSSDQLPTKEGYFRAVRQEPVQFGEIGGHTQINYVQWYECGTTIPGKW